MNKKGGGNMNIKNIIKELREHDPDILDETNDCHICNAMIELSKEIGEFP